MKYRAVRPKGRWIWRIERRLGPFVWYVRELRGGYGGAHYETREFNTQGSAERAIAALIEKARDKGERGAWMP